MASLGGSLSLLPMSSGGKTMRAVAIERFGGEETLGVREVPVPAVGDDEVLVRLAAAGVGEWDPFERDGGFAEMQETQPSFPYVLGSEGAGEVQAVGRSVKSRKVGDRVLAVGFLNPKGGFYAEYAALPADLVAPIPAGMTDEQAAGVGGVGTTALRGLQDVLEIGRGQTVLIFGASGAMGHVAVQLARRLGARVLAVASGADGVRLAREVGADRVVDGRGGDDVVRVARELAPDGLDAALLTAGGPAAEASLQALRSGGRVAYPEGVDPEPKAPVGVKLTSFNGDPDPEIVGRLSRLMGGEPFKVHVHRTFPLSQVADAHRALEEHHLGKLVLRVA
jgi:NADPH:quinone reductase